MELLNQQSHIYKVSNGEHVSIEVVPKGTPQLVQYSLDNIVHSIQLGEHLEFVASKSTHIVELVFTFIPSAPNASYSVGVSGSHGGLFSFEVTRGNPDLTKIVQLTFLVGDTGPK